LNQEPSISIPLALGDGHLKHFPQTLYRHITVGRVVDYKEREDKMPNCIENYSHILRTVIKSFSIKNVNSRKKLLVECDFFEIKLRFSNGKSFLDRPDEKLRYSTQLARLVNQFFIPTPNIQVDTVLLSGYKPLFRMIENCILEIRHSPIKEVFATLCNKRIICYGALGYEAMQLLPALLETEMKPDVLWDVAAEPASSICGITVVKPVFSTLSKDDVLIILPNTPSILEQISTLLEEAGVLYIINNNDIVQYLGEWYYPSFSYNNCRFIWDT
jgi:hypothetical protein